MFMTEKDAEKKHCCGPDSAGTAPRSSLNPGQRLCRGSLCMAWRWVNDPYEYCKMDNRMQDPKRGLPWLTHSDGPPPKPVGEGWEPCHEPRQADGFVSGVLEQRWRRLNTGRTGYCGLAGKSI